MRIAPNIKFHEILWISSQANSYHKIFVTDTQTHRQIHRQTDRHFPNIVKSCSWHPETCNSIENWKSKICTKPILSSTYIEESKNHKYCLPFKYMKSYITYVTKRNKQTTFKITWNQSRWNIVIRHLIWHICKQKMRYFCYCCILWGEILQQFWTHPSLKWKK